MKELKDLDFSVSFTDTDEAQEFFDEMKDTDQWKDAKLNECRVNLVGPEAYSLSHDGVEYPIHPMAMKNIETVSEADANGNYLLTRTAYAAQLTEYFRLHPDKCRGKFIVRGGSKTEPGILIGYHTSQYQDMSQADLFRILMKCLKTRAFGYRFLSGTYTHEFTKFVFVLENAITAEYKDAWKKAGLDEDLLDRSKVYLTFTTNDVGSSQARIVLTCKAGGDTFLLGEPKEVKHRVGGGGLALFESRLSDVDITIDEEMSSISKLMGVTVIHPEAVVVRAMQECKLENISKKACKELIDEMFFVGPTSAYVIYLFLCGIINTDIGSGLSEERKFRILTALRALLKRDWTKLDKPGPTTL